LSVFSGVYNLCISRHEKELYDVFKTWITKHCQDLYRVRCNSEVSRVQGSDSIWCGLFCLANGRIPKGRSAGSILEDLEPVHHWYRLRAQDLRLLGMLAVFTDETVEFGSSHAM
jgi:hypothetical protein